MRRAIPLLLVLLTLVPEAALAGQWWRCRSDQKVRPACCCGQGAHAGDAAPAAEPRVRKTPCCDLLTNTPQALQARLELTATHRVPAPDVIPVALAGVAVGGSGARVVPAPAERAVAPPGRPAPIYLRHVSLLL